MNATESINSIVKIPVSQIVLDESIYPRSQIDRKRVGMFADNLRDGFQFDPIEVESHPDKKERYRILDGAHRFSAHQDIGANEVNAVVQYLNGSDPLLYAAQKAIGPQQLSEPETRETARRAYQRNPKLSSSDIGKAIGRSRQAVDGYVQDLRAAIELTLDIKLFRMNRLGIPQERIAERLNCPTRSVAYHLAKMPELAMLPNDDLKRGFTVTDVAKKHGWSEPMVWSLALNELDDLGRLEKLKWGLRTWDVWNFNECDPRFGDEWPGRIPAQLVAHVLYYFTNPGDLIVDPMAGGGVVPDVCLAFNRKCWSFDMADRPEERPEIEPYHWQPDDLNWPINSKSKPDLIFFDPPYFDKKDDEYQPGSISSLSRIDYLNFFERFFSLAYENSKSTSRLAFLIADWREFIGKAAVNENPANAITIIDYNQLLENTGWKVTHFIDCPLSSARFNGVMVAQMQKNRTIGVIRRSLLIASKKGK